MEVKIGISRTNREIIVDTDATSSDVSTNLENALRDNQVFQLTDVQGRTVLIPAQQIAYLELGSENQRRVGFGALK